MRGNLSLLDKTVEVFKLNIVLLQRSSSRSGHFKKATKYPTKFWTENCLVVEYLSGNPWKIPSLMARLIQKKYFDGIEKKDGMLTLLVRNGIKMNGMKNLMF